MGHSCVKGRFAWGYATHPDRITTPMIRNTIDEPWQKVSWETALNHASEFRRIQSMDATQWGHRLPPPTKKPHSGKRKYFGNNVDTCARVCHSPTGRPQVDAGESAGTQTLTRCCRPTW